MYNLEEFEAYLIKNRGMRGNSSRTYRFHVNEFLKHFEKPPEQISNSEIIDYLDYLRKEEKQGTNSRRLAKTAIERFYAWFSVQNSLPNPAVNLPKIKEYISDPRLVNPDEIERLINACDEFRSDFLKKRNAAIISILASTGIRIEEFEKIKIGDIQVIRNSKGDPSHLELSVNSVKGSHARTVPFNAFDSNDLCSNVFMRYYLYVLTGTKQGRENPLFWSTSRHGYTEERDVPYTRAGVNVMLDAVRKKGYIEKKVNCHSFRHFYATYSIINKIDIIKLQRLMGHSRVTTTMRYIHIASRLTGELLEHSPVKRIRPSHTSAGFTALGKSLLKQK